MPQPTAVTKVQSATMTQNLRSVAIGEIIVSRDPTDVLIAYGVGSCVAVCIFDPTVGVGGMLHALLPSAQSKQYPGGPKFVDEGIPLMIDALIEEGARSNHLIAYLCGGAQVLDAPGFDSTLNIGERNVKTAVETLESVRIPIQAQVTGGKIGRTIKFYIAEGQVTLRSLEHGEKPIE